jgi:homopolymeric O-antigen transport system permease protein
MNPRTRPAALVETEWRAPIIGSAGKPGAEAAPITLRPTRWWPPVKVRELMDYSDLLLMFAARDVKVRYRQTLLGVGWVVLQPLLAAGIFTFVFSLVAGLRTEGIPYFLFSLGGLLAWNLFSSTLSRTSLCMIGNGYLITKVYFPRLILPLSAIAATLIDFLPSFALVLVLLVAYGVWPGWPFVLLPVWILVLLVLSLGAGLIAAALTIHYRDVQYVVPVLISLLLYSTPVAYDVSHIPVTYRQLLFIVNPLASLVTAFRWSLLGSAPPPWAFVALASVFSIILFILGTIAFRWGERRAADVI